MSVLLLDLEATSLEPKTAKILEVGAMLCTDDFLPVGHVSQLVWESGYPALTDDVKRVTKISESMLLESGISLKEALKLVGDLVPDDLRFIIAFNREYDETLLKTEMGRQDLSTIPKVSTLLDTQYLCAMKDIESHYQFKSWRLSHLALEYQVPVNPKELHRAINDVELMRQMLVASGTTCEQMLEFQKAPWVYVAAQVKAPWEDQGRSTGMAKQLGYAWQQCRGDDKQFAKQWVRRIKEKDLAREKQECPFVITMAEEKKCS